MIVYWREDQDEHLQLEDYNIGILGGLRQELLVFFFIYFIYLSLYKQTHSEPWEVTEYFLVLS